MKSILFITVFLLLFFFSARGQDGLLSADRIFQQGIVHVVGFGGHGPDYQKAITCFIQAAELGHSKAMNYLGNMAARGIGMQPDTALAVSWFEKSANAGYGKALYNMGLVYKFGHQVDVNYRKSYEYFLNSAKAGHPGGMYGVGYYLFKGLGVEQDYAKAFEWFKLGAEHDRSSCKYMLGVCYRNGYGVEVDQQKALYWLEAAAKEGMDVAYQELKEPLSEINQPTDKSIGLSVQGVSIPIEYKEVEYKGNTNFFGKWKGLIARYDYSGKTILNVRSIVLVIEQDGHWFNGRWKQGDTLQFVISGYVTDSLIYYKEGSYIEPDRYQIPLDWRLDYGTFAVREEQGCRILEGSVNLYSTFLKEPSGPTFLLVQQSINNKAGNNDSSIAINKNQEARDILKIDSSLEYFNSIQNFDSKNIVLNKSYLNRLKIGSSIKVFPNPFVDKFFVGFVSDSREQILQIKLFDLNGKLVFQREIESIEPGYNQILFIPDVSSGTYILHVDLKGYSVGRLLQKK